MKTDRNLGAFEIADKQSVTWDLVSLGEVVLRLDPGDMRIATTRQFQVFEGGGEYNVARGPRRCFGLRTAIVTVLADNARKYVELVKSTAPVSLV
jgi:2-dehydro-3-deoxygluconokinase